MESCLSYEQGLFRAWRVFSSGMGFDIPVYNLFRMYKNYQLCREGQELDWDEECLVKVQDENVFGGWCLFWYRECFWGARFSWCCWLRWFRIWEL